MRIGFILLGVLPIFAAAPTARILSPQADTVHPVGSDFFLSAFVDDSAATVTWTLSTGDVLTGNNLFVPMLDGEPLHISMVATNQNGESSVPDTRILYPNVSSDFVAAPIIDRLLASQSAVNPGVPVDITAEFTDPEQDGPFLVHWFWLENERPQRATTAGVLENVNLPLVSGSQQSYRFWATVEDAAGNYSFPGFVNVLVKEGNLPPTARIIEPDRSRIQVLVGTEVTFVADGFDPEGNAPLVYNWIDTTGQILLGSTVTIAFEEAGFFTVILQARDSLGNVDPSNPSVLVEVVEELTSPLASILFPRADTRIVAGDPLFLSGRVSTGVDPRWRLIDVATGETAVEVAGAIPGRVDSPAPGLYRLLFQSEDNGILSAEDGLTSRWVSVQARDDNRAPVLEIGGESRVSYVRNGESLTVSVNASDPDQDAIRLYWSRNNVFVGEGESTRTFSFDLPDDVFPTGGAVVQRIDTHALDARMKAPNLPLYQQVIVYEDVRPPRGFINGLPDTTTIFHPVGQPLPLQAEVDNPANVPLAYAWEAFYLNDLANFFSSDQAVPEPPVPDKEGVIFLSLKMATPDGAVVDPLGSLQYVLVYNPDLKPSAQITEPAVAVLRAEPGEPVTLTGLFIEPNSFQSPFPGVTFLEPIRNVLTWQIDGPGGFTASYMQNEPLTVILDAPGEYRVQLTTENSLGLTSETADAMTILVAEPQPDSSFEPNDTRETAVPVTAGALGGLSLSDTDPEDWYRIAVAGEGLTLRWNIDLRQAEINMGIDIYQGERLVQTQVLRAGQRHPFTFVSSAPGTYFLRLKVLDTLAAKSGLDFSLNVEVLQPRLVFPFVKTDEVDETLLTLLNPTGETADVTLVARDSTGNSLSETSINLPAGGHVERSVALFFATIDPLDIAWVQVLSNRSIQGLSTTLGRDEATGVAEPAFIGGLETLVIPHIAVDTANWFTRAALVNSAGEVLDARLEAPGGQFPLAEVTNANHGTVVDFETFFGGQIDAANEWGRVVETSAKAGLSGVELFGTKQGNPRLAALMLTAQSQSNPNFVFRANEIVFPHIAEDTVAFWTGIAFVNLADVATNVALRAYSTDGTLLAERLTSLAPFEKQVGLAHNFFPELDGALAWISLSSDGPISGYELFGDWSNDRLAGLQAVRGGATNLTFSKVQVKAGELWTGIAVVNLSGDATANLTYRAYAADGSLLATGTGRTIGPFRKDVALVETLFDGGLPAGTCWIQLEASEPVAGFTLFGNLTNRFMAGSVAQ